MQGFTETTQKGHAWRHKILIIIVLLIIVLIHSCDGIFIEGGGEIIIVGEAVNKQRFIVIGSIISVTHGECINYLDDPGWNWYLSYFLLACNHTPCL